MLRKFRVEVSVRLDFFVQADNERDACERARGIACSRSMVDDHEINRIEVAELELEQRGNLRAWQERESLAKGTFHDRQRWRDGCLPDMDLVRIAGAEIFRPLDMLPRFDPHDSVYRAVHAHCGGGDVAPWAVKADPTLNDRQWRTYMAILSGCDQIRSHYWLCASPKDFMRVEICEYRIRCAPCDISKSELVVRIEIDWADRLLSRAYVL